MSESLVRQAHEWMWNNIKYVSDYELFGVKQCSVPPEKTIEMGCGDCEDMAMVVRHKAIELGVDEKLMSIDLCLVNGAEQHAVLNYNNGQLICDSLLKEPRPLAKRTDLSNFRKWL